MASDPLALMNATGIGYAGIDGVWWLPAGKPFSLPRYIELGLVDIAAAIFALYDTVAALLPLPEGRDLRGLLTYRVPERLAGQLSCEPVYMVRPDFQLCPDGDGCYRLVATELEICPSAQGFATAMQIGYGLATDLADWLVRFLDGRPFVIAATADWSEFLFDQLAFCRALVERGASARLVLSEPIDSLAQAISRGEKWTPPMFGVPESPAAWDRNLCGRLRDSELDRFLSPHSAWSSSIGEAVVFRFGYLENFSREQRHTMTRWTAGGAIWLNPPSYHHETKALLAVARLPAVRERLEIDAVRTLDSCLPETRLVTPEALPALQRDRGRAILKYAGFDGGEQAWGGRSVQFGRHHTEQSWADTLASAAKLPWPVVAQGATRTARADVGYVGSNGNSHRLKSGYTRLRAFLLRGHDGRPDSAGAHITIAAAPKVAESTTSIQAPVVFEASDI